MSFFPRGPQSGSFTFGRFRTAPRVLEVCSLRQRQRQIDKFSQPSAKTASKYLALFGSYRSLKIWLPTSQRFLYIWAFSDRPEGASGVFCTAIANRQMFATVSENCIKISCFVRKLQKFENMASNKPVMKNIQNKTSQRLIFPVLLVLWP